MKPIRPKFTNPPLIERAISVSFSKLEAFSIGDYGLYWSKLIDQFPISEAASPVIQEPESFNEGKPPQPQIQILPNDTLPRAFFRSAKKGELIQLQSDRFSFNWIKAHPDDPYPHSEEMLSRFKCLFEQFSAFAAERQLGEITPTQCEITNVNLISVIDVGESYRDVATLIRLPDIEEFECVSLESQIVGATHLILDDFKQPIGRVHSIAQPAFKTDTNQKAFRLDIVARGSPIGPGLEGVKAFLEFAVSAVNAVFLASVTHAGRQFWGEIDGK